VTTNISTRQLRAFVALSELKNFTRAAERCGLSQPAFSAVIQGLETTAGVRLFERSTRHVELTPEGDLVEEWARRLLADFETAFTHLNNHVTLRAGRVGVAALPTLAATWLPPVLAKYRVDYPGVGLELFDCLADVGLEMVRQGRADLAVTAGGSDHPDFEAQRLIEDPFLLVCRRDDPLVEAPEVRLADLAGRAFIHMVRSSSIRQRVDAALGDIPLNATMEVTHLATVAGLITCGMGISILPASALARLHEDELKALPLAGADLHRTIYLVHARGRGLSAAAQVLRQSILAHETQAPELQVYPTNL
jgi:DNA-binding transcriptional LysR family regulator